MTPFERVTSRVVHLPDANIDTDQIIPARFLKVTDRIGLGEHLFEDLRRDNNGAPRGEFPLNRPEARGAAILLAGKNFGCGSSREHAAWALHGAGFRVILSTSFADIFRGNALTNGILPVSVTPDLHASLARLAEEGGELTVDLSRLTAEWSSGSFPFQLEPFARECLLKGVDPLGYILSHAPAIKKYEATRQGAL